MVLAESRNESVEATVQQIRGRPRHADAIDPSELTGSGGKAAQAGRAPQRGTIANDDEDEDDEDEDEDAEGDAANGGGGGPNNRPPRPAGYADPRQSVPDRARLTLRWRLDTGGVQAHVGARSRVQGAAGQQPPQGRRAAQDDPRPLFRLSPPCARVQYIAVANKHAQTLAACDPRGEKNGGPGHRNCKRCLATTSDRLDGDRAAASTQALVRDDTGGQEREAHVLVADVAARQAVRVCDQGQTTRARRKGAHGSAGACPWRGRFWGVALYRCP